MNSVIETKKETCFLTSSPEDKIRPFEYRGSVWRLVWKGLTHVRVQDHHGNTKVITQERLKQMQLGI